MKGRQPPPRARPVRSFLACYGAGLLLAGGVYLVARGSGPGPRDARTPPRPPVEEGGGRAGRPALRDLEAAQVHFRRAYEHLSAERFGEAFREFNDVCRLDPEDPRPYVGLAKIYQALDYYERAEQAYRRALEIRPGYHPAKKFLARILCDSGRNEESLALLREVASAQPQDALVWAEIGVNEIWLGNPEKAIPLLERYSRAEPRDGRGYASLGRAYAAAGRLEDAERAYRKALAIEPKTSLAHLWLGQLLMATDRREEGERLLKTYRRLRNLQTRERELEQAVARRPENVGAAVKLLVKLAQVREALGNSREALIPLSRALQLAPRDTRLRKLYESQKHRAVPTRGK